MARGKDELAHTNAQNGDFACKVLDGIPTDTGVGGGMTRTRADDELGGLLGDEIV